MVLPGRECDRDKVARRGRLRDWGLEGDRPFAFYNTHEEVERFIAGVEKAVGMLR